MNPFAAAPTYKKMLTVVGVFLAMITSIFLSSSTSILLPVAADEIGGMDIYPLASSIAGCLGIALMPLYGFIAAKNPAAKRTLAAASFIVSGVIVLSRGFAQSMWFIVIPSVIFSLYSPAIYVLGYSTIRDMFSKEQAGATLGLAGTMQSIGILAGAPLIGLLTDLAGWRLPFYILGPLFFVAAALVLCGVSVTKEDVKDMAVSGLTFDFVGALAIIVFLAAVTLALSLTSYLPFGSAGNWALWVLAVAAAALLVWDVTQKKARAFIPSIVLSDRNVISLLCFTFFINFSIMGCYIFLPVYARYAMGQSSAAAGLILTFMSIVGLFLGPIYGRIIGKEQNARNIALLAAGVRILVLLAFAILLNPTTSIFLVYVLMLIMGFSSSAGSVVPAAGPQSMIAPEKRQMGNSVVQLGSGFGSSISIAIFTMVIASRPDSIVGAIQPIMIISLAGAVVMFLTNFMMHKLATD
ncbi:MAG: MFS transporter [Lachnospiraceae bacterium]|jgi:MFS family permease|nr:MFS transporter [Lachnospiraceae bacterium]